MRDQVFKYHAGLKQLDEKPEKCDECGHNRMLKASFANVPLTSRHSKTTNSDRYVWMCQGCGAVLGLVREGISMDQYISTFTDGDHGERYIGISKAVTS